MKFIVSEKSKDVSEKSPEEGQKILSWMTIYKTVISEVLSQRVGSYLLQSQSKEGWREALGEDP